MLNSFGLIVLGLTLVCASSYNMGHNSYNMGHNDLGYNNNDQYNVHAYAAPSYAAPAYSSYSEPSYQQDYNDVKQIVDYKYAVNDYYGNEQSRNEHIDDYGTNGDYHVLLPDGRRESVSYDSGAYGHLAQVDIVQTPYAATSYSAPSYSAPSYNNYNSYNSYNSYKPTVAPYVYQAFHQRMVPIVKYAPSYSAPSNSAY